MAEQINKEFEILLFMKDKMTPVLQKSREKIKDFRDNVQTAADATSAWNTAILGMETALGIAVGTALVKASKQAMDYGDALAGMKKVLTDGEITRYLPQIEADVSSLSSQFAISKTVILESMAGWKQAGFEAIEVNKLASNTLKLKVAGDMSAAESTQILIATLKGFRAPAEESAKVIDIINEVSNKFATNAKELGVAMGDISPIAYQMGFSMEEAAGLATPIIEVFGSGSEAAIALKTGLLSLQNPTKKARGVFEQLGISLTSANGELRTGKEIYYDVAKAFGTLSSAQKAQITTLLVGKDQSARMVQVFDQLNKVMDVTQVALKSQGSAMLEVASKTSTSKFAVEQLKVTYDNVFGTIGAKYDQTLKEVAEAGTGLLATLDSLIKSGAFDEFFDLINAWGEELVAFFEDLTKNLPGALEQVDFGAFVRNIEDLKKEISALFTAMFGEISSEKDLAQSIQNILSWIGLLQDYVKGVIEHFVDVAKVVKKFVSSIEDGDSAFVEFFGNVQGLMSSLSRIVPLLDSGWAAIAAGGFIMKSVTGNVIDLVGGVGKLIDKIPDIGIAGGELSRFGKVAGALKAPVSGLSLGVVGLAGAAGAIGVAFGTWLNSFESVQNAVQGLFGALDKLVTGTKNATDAELAHSDAMWNEKMRARYNEKQKAMKANQETLTDLGKTISNFPKDIDLDFSLDGTDWVLKRLAEVDGDISKLTSKERKILLKLTTNDEAVAEIERKVKETEKDIQMQIDLDVNPEKAKKNSNAYFRGLLKGMEEYEQEAVDSIGNIEKRLEIADFSPPIELDMDKVRKQADKLYDEMKKKEFDAKLKLDADLAKLEVQRQWDQKDMVLKAKLDLDMEQVKQAWETERYTMELDYKLDVEKINAQSEKMKEMFKFQAEIGTKQIEQDTAQITGLFESLQEAGKATGDTISDALGILADMDMFDAARWDIKKQIEIANEHDERRLAMQEKLAEAQAEYMRARTEKLYSDEGIAINVKADGLQPHLENIWFDVIDALHVKVSDMMGEALIGLIENAPPEFSTVELD